MGYVTIGSLGSTSSRIGDYYASSTSFQSSKIRKIHDDLKAADIGWQKAISGVLKVVDWIPDQNVRTMIRALGHYPLPLAADLAVILEVTAGGRPLDQSAITALHLLEDRATSSAEFAGGAAAVLVTVAGVVGALSATGVLAPGTVPAAGVFATWSAIAAGIAALEGTIAAVVDGVINGHLSEDDYKSLVRAGATATGTNVSDDAIDDSADVFMGAQEAVTQHDAQQAAQRAKMKAAAKKKAREKTLASKPPTKVEQAMANARAQALGVQIPWRIIGVGAGVFAVIFFLRTLKRRRER